MKRPSFQFYPADWRNNAKLRRCSWEARGVWVEVMCLLHDSDEYGLLRWTLKEIAQATGAPLKLLNELVSKEVLKGNDAKHEALIYIPRSGRKDGAPVTLIEAGNGAIWFSSRMVIDEHIRQKKGNHELYKDSPNYSPKPPIGEVIGDTPIKAPKPPKSDLPTSTSTSTSKDLKTITPEGVSDSVFQDFLKLRKTLKAPVTETAINGLRREAQKANLSLQAVMEICCQQGWRGFKAEWMAEKPQTNLQSAYDRKIKTLSGLTGGIHGNSSDAQFKPITETKTIDMEQPNANLLG